MKDLPLDFEKNSKVAFTTLLESETSSLAEQKAHKYFLDQQKKKRQEKLRLEKSFTEALKYLNQFEESTIGPRYIILLNLNPENLDTRKVENSEVIVYAQDKDKNWYIHGIDQKKGEICEKLMRDKGKISLLEKLVEESKEQINENIPYILKKSDTASRGIQLSQSQGMCLRQIAESYGIETRPHSKERQYASIWIETIGSDLKELENSIIIPLLQELQGEERSSVEKALEIFYQRKKSIFENFTKFTDSQNAYDNTLEKTAELSRLSIDTYNNMIKNIAELYSPFELELDENFLKKIEIAAKNLSSIDNSISDSELIKKLQLINGPLKGLPNHNAYRFISFFLVFRSFNECVIERCRATQAVIEIYKKERKSSYENFEKLIESYFSELKDIIETLYLMKRLELKNFTFNIVINFLKENTQDFSLSEDKKYILDKDGIQIIEIHREEDRFLLADEQHKQIYRKKRLPKDCPMVLLNCVTEDAEEIKEYDQYVIDRNGNFIKRFQFRAITPLERMVLSEHPNSENYFQPVDYAKKFSELEGTGNSKALAAYQTEKREQARIIKLKGNFSDGELDSTLSQELENLALTEWGTAE